MDLDPNAKPKSRRGSAAMNPERRREIARKGGASVPGENAASPRTATSRPRPVARAENPRGGGRTRGPLED